MFFYRPLGESAKPACLLENRLKRGIVELRIHAATEPPSGLAPLKPSIEVSTAAGTLFDDDPSNSFTGTDLS